MRGLLKQLYGFVEMVPVLEGGSQATIYLAPGDYHRVHAPFAATITAHHLLLNRNAMFDRGFHPHAYCLPVAKREHHRQALLKAASSSL